MKKLDYLSCRINNKKLEKEVPNKFNSALPASSRGSSCPRPAGRSAP
jgi:hypothetical protein